MSKTDGAIEFYAKFWTCRYVFVGEKICSVDVSKNLTFAQCSLRIWSWVLGRGSWWLGRDGWVRKCQIFENFGNFVGGAKCIVATSNDVFGAFLVVLRAFLDGFELVRGAAQG